jgi:hypothetical protein
MKSEEYPLLFRQSDLCAIANQRRYFRLLMTKIGLLLVIAAFASFSWSPGLGVEVWTGLSIATALAVLMILNVIGDLKKFDRISFAARSIAEIYENWKQKGL